LHLVTFYSNYFLDHNYLSNPFSSDDSCPNKSKNSIKNKKKSILDQRYIDNQSNKYWYINLHIYFDFFFSAQFLLWPLARGWALKSAQKYGKKGGGKRISKKVWHLLQGYFLEGNIDKSERHTAESMLSQLKKCVENGIIDEEEVPKLETIRNWISRYASQHRQEAAIASKK
jgi:hypothetical protein